MASSITNISEISHPHVIENDKSKALSYSEELEKINKVKYNLSILYFSGLAVLLTTLLW